MARITDILPTNLEAQQIRNCIYDRACSTPFCVICYNGKEGDYKTPEIRGETNVLKST